MPESINRDTWDEPELRRILTARYVGALYRALKGLGVSQRQIAERTGQAQFAVNAVRAYGEVYVRERTNAELLLSEVQVRSGEPRGLILAGKAIKAVQALQSIAVRRERLQPLAAALEARPGSDMKQPRSAGWFMPTRAEQQP